MNELISVIVPVYNVEKYLRKAVQSIQNQTYKHLEIMLINDGSTDTSAAVCEEYLHRDSRIRIVQKKLGGSGVGAARNSALPLVTGDFILFVDNDDWLELNHIEILYQDLKETIIDSIEQLKKNKLKVEGIQALEKVYDIYEEDIKSLEKIDTTTWDTMLTGLKNKTWTRYVGNIKASEGEKAIKSELGEIRKNIKAKLTGIEFLSQKDAVLELNAMYPTLKYLADIIEEFDKRYIEAKREKNIIDYSDLEHLSLQLLVDENNKKTEIANKIKSPKTRISRVRIEKRAFILTSHKKE